MAQDSNNVYGIQKVEETDVRTNGDIAKANVAASAKGAAAGAQFGPWGALIGAGIYGTAAIVGGKSAQSKEKEMLEGDKAYNEFVGNLEDRALRDERTVVQQAQKGMSSNKYQLAEIEGDGSNRYQEGIGEIVTDKNYNLKYDASGKARHTEGGVKVTLEDGDIVFPTQNSDKKYKSVKADIRRYKVHGDERAKKRLDKLVEKLPSNEDYENNTYGEGGVIEGDIETINKNGWTYKKNHTTGEIEVKKHGSDTWRNIKQQEAAGDVNEAGTSKIVNYDKVNEVFKDSQWKSDVKTDAPVEDTPEVLLGEDVPYSDPGEINYGDIGEGQGPEINLDDKENLSKAFTQDDIGKERDEDGYFTPTVEDEAVVDDTTEVEEDGTKRRFDPNSLLKHASAVGNLLKGMEPAERVTRRSFVPDEMKYQDRSESARQANVENRNFMMRRLANRVGRSGSLGTAAQVGARYLRTAENINEMEARRFDQIENANVMGANRAKEINFRQAYADDAADAANRAARQAFTSTGLAETAELAQMGEQRRYMMDRDAKMDARDQNILDKGYLDRENAYIDKEGRVRYSGRYGQNRQ